jgi:hypothetical protein
MPIDTASLLTPAERRERAIRDIHDAVGVVVNEKGERSYPKSMPPVGDEKTPRPKP